MSIGCGRSQVGVGSGSCGHMWTGGGGQKPDFFVDVINGWPLEATAMFKGGSIQGFACTNSPAITRNSAGLHDSICFCVLLSTEMWYRLFLSLA